MLKGPLQKLLATGPRISRLFTHSCSMEAATENCNSAIAAADPAAATQVAVDSGQTSEKPLADDLQEPEAKKAKLEDGNEVLRDGLPFRKKKVALMMMYSGKGYIGMQKNPGVHTVEDDLLSALVKAGLITPDHASEPGKKMEFQRAARTDKGVSAAGQLCSLKIFVDVENPVEKVNSHLPDQIRVLDIKKATKKFNSKNSCCGRSYGYTMPTFAFAPLEEKVTEEYRITSPIIQKVNSILSIFKGTHNFHNYSSGRKANDPSARRYITDFQCGDPFMQDGLELVEITVKGQSFILHQIRKMIGLTIAVVRGFAGMESIEKTWGPDRVDVPRAPGLGLVLEKTHYDWYNKKYGKDGIHKTLDWDDYKEEIIKFKKEFIFREIIETEKNEKSMLEWLATLPLHSFDIIPDSVEPPYVIRTPLGAAARQVHLHNKAEQQVPASEESTESMQEQTRQASPQSTEQDMSQQAVGTDDAVSQLSVGTDTPQQAQASQSDDAATQQSVGTDTPQLAQASQSDDAVAQQTMGQDTSQETPEQAMPQHTQACKGTSESSQQNEERIENLSGDGIGKT